MFSTGLFLPFVRLFVCYQVCEHGVLKPMNRFCCKLALMVHGQGDETVKFGGLENRQSSRLQEAEVTFGVMILDPLGSNSFSS